MKKLALSGILCCESKSIMKSAVAWMNGISQWCIQHTLAKQSIWKAALDFSCKDLGPALSLIP